MLKNLFQFSIIYIINVNCGLIKSELSNNQTTTDLQLTNLIENVTLRNTTPFKISTNLDLNLMESYTTDATTHAESNTFPQNASNLSAEESRRQIPITENIKKTTSTIHNLKEFSTTTDQSELEISSTIFNNDEVAKNKNGNILVEADYTTEMNNQDSQNVFTTSETTTSSNDDLVQANIQNTTDKNGSIKLAKVDNTNNNNANNNNSSNRIKSHNQKLENVSSISTEFYNISTTPTNSLDHQLKLNKNYDIVTNEIANLTIPNSTGNLKLAKFFKENSTNSKDLTFTDSGGDILSFSGIKKNIKDREKLKENIVNKTLIAQNVNPDLIHTKVPSNSSIILKDYLPTPATHIFITNDTIKTKEAKDYPSKGDVNNIEENSLMKINETEVSNTSSVNNHNQKSSLNKNLSDINSLNYMNTVNSSYVELATTDKPTISTANTETIIYTTTDNINENFTQYPEDYQSTKIYVTKNSGRDSEIMANISNILIMLTTEKTDVMVDNVTDYHSTSTVPDMITTEGITNNNLEILQNLSTSTFPDSLTTTEPSVDQNFTTYISIDLKGTTPVTEDSFSTTVTEPESSIETNSIEKTDKSITDVYSSTTPYFNRLPVTTVPPSKLDMKQYDTNDTTITSITTISTNSTESSIEHIINATSQIMKATIIEPTLNKSNSSEYEGMERSSNEPDYNVIIAISVSVIGIVALILLVGFLYVMRKRQKQLTYGQRCRPVSLDAYSLDNVSIYNSVRRKAVLRASKRSYGNAAFDDPALIHNNISINDLAKFVERKSAIYEEFKGIPQIIARTDEVPQGCEEKNRYANVIPLPETRVVLQQIGNDEKTEYINANFVRGPKDSPNYYIACQAPLQGTVVDFWRMIWEQNSHVIIMATDLIENGIEKCADYLPASITLDNHIIFGDFQITLKNREVKEKYAVSILYLKNMEKNLSREITHFWYQWPETGVPIDQAGVIAMLLEARSSLKAVNTDQADPETKSITGKITNEELNGSLENNKGILKTQGPLVIHCSPGTGRTGTITTIDIALRSLETTKSVDIPQIVYYVRRGRASSVQTTEQYEFIYRVVNVYAKKISGTTNDN